MGLCSFLLVNDSSLALFIPKTSYDTKVIGKVVAVIGDARRRYQGDILWAPVRVNSAILDSDTYFTGPRGKVKLHIEKATTLEINSDSMINVRQENNGTILNLESGSLHSSSTVGDLVKIKVNQKTISMQLNESGQDINHQSLATDNSEESPNTPSNTKPKNSPQAGASPEPSSLAPSPTPSVSPSPLPNDTSPPKIAEEVIQTTVAPTPQQMDWYAADNTEALSDHAKRNIIITLFVIYGLFSLVVAREIYKSRKR